MSVRYVADGAAAATLLSGGQVDFIVVGEPAATAQTKRLSLNAEMNIQTEYSKVSGATSFPQAGIFVKSALASDEAFMKSLFEELAANKEWVAQNKASVTAEAKKYTKVQISRLLRLIDVQLTVQNLRKQACEI